MYKRLIDVLNAGWGPRAVGRVGEQRDGVDVAHARGGRRQRRMVAPCRPPWTTLEAPLLLPARQYALYLTQIGCCTQISTNLRCASAPSSAQCAFLQFFYSTRINYCTQVPAPIFGMPLLLPARQCAFLFDSIQLYFKSSHYLFFSDNNTLYSRNFQHQFLVCVSGRGPPLRGGP